MATECKACDAALEGHAACWNCGAPTGATGTTSAATKKTTRRAAKTSSAKKKRTAKK